MTDQPAGSPATGSSERVLTATTAPYYLGGFLGPFGTIAVISIYPELRDTFDASTSAVNWSFSGYLLPMALLMLVSGTIGERYGRRRVTRLTFILYAVASFGCVVAPTLRFFVGARVLQGVCNAFITPLLIAGLTEVIAPSRLGRAVGVYAAFQAAGGAVAPFASGLAALVNWRLVFVVIGLVALALATRPPNGEPRPAAAAPPIRPLFTPRMMALWVAAFTAAAGPIGMAVLVGVRLRDGLDVGSSAAGLALLVSGLATMAFSPTWGRLIDSWGTRRAAVVAAGSVTAATAPLGFIGSAWVLAVCWVAASALLGFVAVNLQHLGAIAVPDNRGGALSSVLSFRFFGHAVGPVIWVPLLADTAGLAFVCAAALGLVTLGAFLVATRSG